MKIEIAPFRCSASLPCIVFIEMKIEKAHFNAMLLLAHTVLVQCFWNLS